VQNEYNLEIPNGQFGFGITFINVNFGI